MKKTVKQYILDNINDEWSGKCDVINHIINCMKKDKEIASHETIGRKLRELAEQGLIKNDYYQAKRGHSLAKYARM